MTCSTELLCLVFASKVRRVMAKRFSSKYRVSAHTSKNDHSPRTGLVALSRAYRGLGLARLVAEYWDEQLKSRGSGKSRQARGASSVLEFMVLAQIAGIDCVKDIGLLRDDT